MRPVFYNQNLENEFQKNGYVHIPNFISKEEVSFLWDQFHHLIKQSGGNIMSGETDINFEGEVTYDFTFIDRNIDYKKAVYKVVDEVFKPHYDKILKNFYPIIANYIRKTPNSGEVPLHENWSFIDEHKATSVSIWCPLVDSHRGNGALEVVPGSHKRFGEVRGPMIPWELEGIKKDIINNDLVTCAIPAGDCIVLDDSIVHYSYPNSTNQLRIAIQLILIPEELPSIHFHVNPEKDQQLVHVLQVDQEFYMQFNPWKKPENVKELRTFRHQTKPLTYSDYKSRLFNKRYDEKMGIIDKLKEVFF